MGDVYRAHDVRLDRDVAVKTIKGPFTERFEREARAISSLNHPHICTLHDVGEHDGSGYLVMEYIEGKPVAGPLPVEQACAYGIQICEALHAAHKKGIVHRDLKPANILLTKQGVKLLDFGLAKLTASGNSGVMSGPQTSMGEQATVAALTGAHTVVGTPQYMAPEQIEAREVDARTDIFAFGCVLYELITGPPRVRWQDLVERDGRGAGHQAAPDRGAGAADAAGPRADRVALPGQGPRGSLADGARRGRRAAVGLAGRIEGRACRPSSPYGAARAKAWRGRPARWRRSRPSGSPSRGCDARPSRRRSCGSR